MKEYELIRRLASRFPRSPRQRNGVLECDAELLDLDGRLWAASLDEFSPAEDGFTDDDPGRLGWNLAVATLSDLFACGAQPAFFLQALCLPAGSAPEFVDGIANGIRDALGETGCFLCGGDLGVGDSWRFTGCALGPVTGDRAVTRRLAVRAADLWVSGPLGDANLALAAGRPTPRFELRLDLAREMAGRAAAGIDTSGGLWDALWLLAECNPNHRFELEIDAIRLAPGLREFCAGAGLPAAAALIGGAGEYELLFAVETSAVSAASLERLGAYRIGCVRERDAPGFFVGAGRAMRPAPPCPDPRAFAERTQYVAEVMRTAALLGATP